MTWTMQIDNIMMSQKLQHMQAKTGHLPCRDNRLQDQQRREEEKIKLKDVEL